jgi:phage-related tail fiber protein
VFVNPEHVVCLMDAGSGRTQVVTTGLSGEASISLVVDLDPAVVAAHLQAEA